MTVLTFEFKFKKMSNVDNLCVFFSLDAFN
jgi:hypothetical protein